MYTHGKPFYDSMSSVSSAFGADSVVRIQTPAGLLVLPAEKWLALSPLGHRVLAQALWCAGQAPRRLREGRGWLELEPGAFALYKAELAALCRCSLPTLNGALLELGPDGLALLEAKPAGPHRNPRTVFRFIQTEPKSDSGLPQEIQHGASPELSAGLEVVPVRQDFLASDVGQEIFAPSAPVLALEVQAQETHSETDRPRACAPVVGTKDSCPASPVEIHLEPNQELEQAAEGLAQAWQQRLKLPLGARLAGAGLRELTRRVARVLGRLARTVGAVLGALPELPERVAERVAGSRFLTGQKPGRGGRTFRATLDWLLHGRGGEQGERLLALLAGRYDDYDQGVAPEALCSSAGGASGERPRLLTPERARQLVWALQGADDLGERIEQVERWYSRPWSYVRSLAARARG